MPVPPFGIRRQRGFVSQAVAPGVVPVSFDIADLALTGYWPDEYAGQPEIGADSAGVSGGRDLPEGGAGLAPSVGAALNGFDTSDYNGSTQYLRSALAVDDFFNTAAYSWWVLFYADTAAVDAGALARYLNPQFFSDGVNAFVGAGFSDSGVHFFHHNTVLHKEIVVACATAGWHLAQGKYDGTDMKLRVDSGARSTLASGNLFVDPSSDNIKFGSDYSGSIAFFDGRMANKGFADFAFSDDEEDDIKDFLNTRYGLAL